MIKLLLPVRDIFITQPFGVNYLNFYKNLGMKGHNGIDFRARRGCPILATHSGIIIRAGQDGGGGIVVEIATDTYKTIYYHLLKVNVKTGQDVKAGQIIAEADNTGKYTTGDHLHFGFKFIENGKTLNKDNGYNGAVDPTPYFANQYGKFWDRPAAYHRYGRKQEWIAEWKMRFKNAWLHRQLIKRGLNPILGIEPINALVYGGWDFETVINPAMYGQWAYLKKSQIQAGKIPFLK